MKEGGGAVRRWEKGRDVVCMIKDEHNTVVSACVHLEPKNREIRFLKLLTPK